MHDQHDTDRAIAAGNLTDRRQVPTRPPTRVQLTRGRFPSTARPAPRPDHRSATR